MRLDQGDAQQQKKGRKRKEKSHFSEFQTTVPGQNLIDAQEEPVTHAAVSYGPVRLPSYNGGCAFVSSSPFLAAVFILVSDAALFCLF